MTFLGSPHLLVPLGPLACPFCMSRPARTRRTVCPLGFPSPSLVKSPWFSYHLLRCLHAAYWKQDWQQYGGTIFNTLKIHHLGSVPIQSAVLQGTRRGWIRARF